MGKLKAQPKELIRIGEMMSTTESNRILRDAFFLFSGIILGFLLQLVYDTIREESFYQNIMPTRYWRTVLAIICGVLWVVMVYALKKRGLK